MDVSRCMVRRTELLVGTLGGVAHPLPVGGQQCGVGVVQGTFHISRDLAAAYRDWSWEARCQLSELVEQALLTYRESRDQRQ